MHDSAFKTAERFYDKYLIGKTADFSTGDIGSFDDNGCVRPIFKRDGYHYTGIDIRPGPNVDIVVPEPYGWSNIPTAAFDCIVSLNTLEHVGMPWLWIMEVKRILKSGGLVFIEAPNTWPYHEHPVDCWRVWPDGLRALFEYAGIETLESYFADSDTVGIGRLNA